MKSVGEVMSIGRTFEEAFQKALRMVDESVLGFDPDITDIKKSDIKDLAAVSELELELRNPTDKRIFFLAAALKSGFDIETLHDWTKIDPWFLHKLQNIVIWHNILTKCSHIGMCINSDNMGLIMWSLVLVSKLVTTI
jgi:carbamoyl-phosphate synthase/aspartate carbamoyltransferase/dihydroorotase